MTKPILVIHPGGRCDVLSSKEALEDEYHIVWGDPSLMTVLNGPNLTRLVDPVVADKEPSITTPPNTEVVMVKGSTPKDAETGEGWAHQELHDVAQKAAEAADEVVESINSEEFEEAKEYFKTLKTSVAEVEKLLGELPEFENGNGDDKEE